MTDLELSIIKNRLAMPIANWVSSGASSFVL